jgi:hypothetical protein
MRFLGVGRIFRVNVFDQYGDGHELAASFRRPAEKVVFAKRFIPGSALRGQRLGGLRRRLQRQQGDE